MSDPQGMERRITERLMAYWTSRKGERVFPALSDIDPKDLEDIWDHCFLIQVLQTPVGDEDEIYRYTHLGESIVAAYGHTIIGADIYTSLMSPSGGRITDFFDKVVASSTPLTEESEFLNTQNIIIRYRQCVFPLGENKGRVDHLLGGMRWIAS